jgi:tryptophan 2,3-dioxygenase
LYYASYLQLEKILSAQAPESAKHGDVIHDETLFIIAHQTYELWFKQIIHELDAVIDMMREETMDDCQLSILVSRLHRVISIQRLLVHQIEILETMTPMDFLEFREYLIPASGFQSVQFKLIEMKLGLVKKTQPLTLKQLEGLDRERILAQGGEPNVLSLVESWLERTPFLEVKNFSFWDNYRQAVEAMINKDKVSLNQSKQLSEQEIKIQEKQIKNTQDYFSALFDETVYQKLLASNEAKLSFRAMSAALFIFLYRDQPILNLPYQLLAALIDIDELLSTWRYRHTLMASRMIGKKIGTGGSSGVSYLEKTLQQRAFSDLMNLSTYLIPRHVLPALPEDFKRSLGFQYQRTS